MMKKYAKFIPILIGLVVLLFSSVKIFILDAHSVNLPNPNEMRFSSADEKYSNYPTIKNSDGFSVFVGMKAEEFEKEFAVDQLRSNSHIEKGNFQSEQIRVADFELLAGIYGDEVVSIVIDDSEASVKNDWDLSNKISLGSTIEDVKQMLGEPDKRLSKKYGENFESECLTRSCVDPEHKLAWAAYEIKTGSEEGYIIYKYDEKGLIHEIYLGPNPLLTNYTQYTIISGIRMLH